jgi:CheY-like chemotaxis protein
VARILILDPHSDVRELIGQVVEHAGHEPLLTLDASVPVDALVVEPASAPMCELAKGVLAAWPETPVVCVSIAAPTDAGRGLRPAAHVLKPFSLAELTRALGAALAARQARSATPA